MVQNLSLVRVMAARPLQACPLCLADLVVRVEGDGTSYSCPSCRSVEIRTRRRETVGQR